MCVLNNEHQESAEAMRMSRIPIQQISGRAGWHLDATQETGVLPTFNINYPKAGKQGIVDFTKLYLCDTMATS